MTERNDPLLAFMQFLITDNSVPEGVRKAASKYFEVIAAEKAASQAAVRMFS